MTIEREGDVWLAISLGVVGRELRERERFNLKLMLLGCCS